MSFDLTKVDVTPDVENLKSAVAYLKKLNQKLTPKPVGQLGGADDVDKLSLEVIREYAKAVANIVAKPTMVKITALPLKKASSIFDGKALFILGRDKIKGSDLWKLIKCLLYVTVKPPIGDDAAAEVLRTSGIQTILDDEYSENRHNTFCGRCGPWWPHPRNRLRPRSCPGMWWT